MLAVREAGWKLIRHAEDGTGGQGSAELYDLNRDAGELEDRIAAREGDASRSRQRLAQQLEVYAAGRASGGEPGEVSDEVRAALEALGYTD